MVDFIPFSPSNFGRYVSQTESNPEEPMNIPDWVQGSPPTTTDLPSLLSFSPVPTADLPTHTASTGTSIPSSLVTDDVESIPYLHHGPGPIQRPNKLNHSSLQASSFSPAKTSVQSPSTPDVLQQINHLIYDHGAHTSDSASNHVHSASVTSPLINDLTTSNIPWTFSPSEWSTKLEPSWPMSTLQSPHLLPSSMPNPFALLSSMSRGDSSLWTSTAAEPSPSRSALSTARTQRAAAWNDFFSAKVPSATTPDATKANHNPWAKYMAAPDPSTNDATSLNGHETSTNNPFWALSSLSTDSVVPTSSQIPPGTPSRIWWTGLSSDENNNTNQTNNDHTTTRDQSRWDFAR